MGILKKMIRKDSIIYQIYPQWAVPHFFFYYFSINKKISFKDNTNYFYTMYNNSKTKSKLKKKYNINANS